VGLGWMEIGTIMVVAMVVFGPERLPALAKQAAQFVKMLRQMAQNAKAELASELGEDFQGMNLRDLDPRAAIRDAMLSEPPPVQTPTKRVLGPNEQPPFDSEAT